MKSMKIQTYRRRQRGKPYKEIDFQHIDFLISILPPEDQDKIKYVESLFHKLLPPNIEDGDVIIFEPMKCKLFKYLLFSLILKYESESNAS